MIRSSTRPGSGEPGGVVHLGRPVLDAVPVAHPVEDVDEGIPVLCPVGELDTVHGLLAVPPLEIRSMACCPSIVGQHGMDAVGGGQDQVAQDLGRLHLAGALDETHEGELAGAVASRAGWPGLLRRSDQPPTDG